MVEAVAGSKAMRSDSGFQGWNLQNEAKWDRNSPTRHRFCLRGRNCRLLEATRRARAPIATWTFSLQPA